MESFGLPDNKPLFLTFGCFLHRVQPPLVTGIARITIVAMDLRVSFVTTPSAIRRSVTWIQGYGQALTPPLISPRFGPFRMNLIGHLQCGHRIPLLQTRLKSERQCSQQDAAGLARRRINPEIGK